MRCSAVHRLRVLGSALTMDKIRTKQVWLSLNLPTPRVLRASSAATTCRRRGAWLGLPVIVKPACEGSSVGVTRVLQGSRSARRRRLASRYEGELLMEQLIEGDEFTVGMLGAEALPTIRIVPPASTTTTTRSTSPTTRSTSALACTGSAEQELGALALEAFSPLVQRLGSRRFHARPRRPTSCSRSTPRPA